MSNSKKMTGFIGLTIANFMAMLLICGIGNLGYTIAASFDGMDKVGLVFALESCCRCAVCPISGKLGEKVGRKQLLIFALILYTASYVMAALANSMTVYLITRIIGGAAWGCWMSNSFMLMYDIFGQDEAPKYSGFAQTASSVAMLAGAPIAGALCAINWRIEFYIAVPILVITTILCSVGIPKSEKSTNANPMDIGGALFCALFLIPFSLAMSFGSTYGWGSTLVIVLIVLTVVGLVGLLICEKKAKDPIMPFHLLKNKYYLSIFMISFFFCVATAAGNYLPSYLQYFGGVSSTLSGFYGTPGTVLCLILTSVLGVKAAKTGKYKGMVNWWCILTAVTAILFLFVGKPIIAAVSVFVYITIANTFMGAGNAMQQIVPYTYYMKVLEPKDMASGASFMIFAGIFANSAANGILGAMVNSSAGLPSIFILPVICLVPMIIFGLMFKDV